MASKQKLSPKAAAAKAARDLRHANSEDRKAKRAGNQRRRRAARKSGKDLTGLEWDHKCQCWKSIKANRGNDGEGTKKEGKENYKILKRLRRGKK